MKKIKPQYKDISGEWWWNYWRDRKGPGYSQKWCYHRSLSSANVDRKRNGWDDADFREMGLRTCYRHRDRDGLPEYYDDVDLSRGYTVRSWKDVSRRKRQWIGK